METHIKLDCVSAAHRGKPVQSIYLEFCRTQAAQILELGEFEALRRWILSSPECFSVPVTPETSHKVTRDFYKKLRKEQKAQ